MRVFNFGSVVCIFFTTKKREVLSNTKSVSTSSGVSFKIGCVDLLELQEAAFKSEGPRPMNGSALYLYIAS